MVKMYRSIMAIVIAAFVVLMLIAFQTEPQVTAQKCVPLYASTGVECVQGNCIS